MAGALLFSGGGGGGGPLPTDSQFTLALGSGSYSWNATTVAAVGGGALSGTGLGLDGATMQVPAGIVSTITESASGVDFTPVGTPSSGWLNTQVATNMNNGRTVVKTSVADIDPSAQFDLQAQLQIATLPAPNLNRVSLALLLWSQGAADWESRGQSWGWAATGLNSGGKPQVIPHLAMSTDTSVGTDMDGDVYRGAGVYQEPGVVDLWVRLHRDENNRVNAQYKTLEADPWTTVDLGDAGIPAMFNGSSVKAGFGLSFGNGGVYRLNALDFLYRAPTP